MIIDIREKDVGARLDKFLSENLPEKIEDPSLKSLISRNFVKNKVIPIVYLDGKVVKHSYRLKSNDQFTISDDDLAKLLLESKESKVDENNIEPQKGELDIIFEDPNYLVINKQKNIVVHPGIGHADGTLINYVKGYLLDKGEYDPMVNRVGLVHRLDRPVGGLIVIAKNRRTQLHLKKQFEQHNVLKIYKGRVSRVPEILTTKEPVEGSYLRDVSKQWEIGKDEISDKKWAMVEGSIARDRLNRKRMSFSSYVSDGTGKSAKMYFAKGENNIVYIRLVTGRMHQIRATLKYLNSTLDGDSLYTEGRTFPEQIELNSVVLGFENLYGKKITYLLV